MTIREILNKWNGKYVDWDGFYGYQCVDWYRQYCHELGLEQSIGVGGAKDIWDTYKKEDFERIKNDPSAVPQLGDIIIWDAYSGNPYGHVGVFDSGDVNSFTSYDQNWPVGSNVHPQAHNYDHVLGWLRRKGLEPVSGGVEAQNTKDILMGLKKATSKDEIEYWTKRYNGIEGVIDSLMREDGVLRDLWLNIWGVPKVVTKTEIIEKEKKVFVDPEFPSGSLSNLLYQIALKLAGK